MTWLAAISFIKRFWPFALALAVVLAFWFLLGRIDAQAEKIDQLQRDLKTEQAARAADVAGLTTLAKGSIAAAVQTSKDERALDHAIATQPVSPSTPLLKSFMQCLRQSNGKDCAAGSPGSAPAK